MPTQRNRSRTLLIASFLVVSGAVIATEAPRSWHQQILDWLNTHDQVIPFAPEVNPVATVYNREAIIPPQCYTKTNAFYNPCYVCHQESIPGRENVMNDGDLQAEYSFSDLGQTNHWKNLFENRADRVASISDKEILEYVANENYTDLAANLKKAEFKGWIPDLKNLHLGAEAFDDEGFAKDGSQWVAFNYKPFPSTFWPTNGSTDDVMIRLPEAFRTKPDGTYSRDIYKANLAILEAKIKGKTAIGALPFDEREIGADLNDDGIIGLANHIHNVDSYVGAARYLFIDEHLYPQGTEFLHSVRYLGFDENGGITSSKRMKELRYMKKWVEYS